MIGKVLGNRYEIIEKIGGGGMSVVYKAKCRVLNRYVAIKILRNELIADQNFVEKFKQESLSAASLNHPNIVNIYDTGIEDNIYYIVMEYIKGETLKDLIKRKENLSEQETVRISVQIAEALKHAHANKIIHRDIKPHNILITEDGIAKVADFGIARAATSSTINNTSNVIGSVHYFSPEQARGGYIDEKSDIYSLGVVMYEMITGTVPFDADNHISVAMKHIQEEVVPPSQKNDKIQISKELENIILKCLEKHQSYRFQNSSELLIALYGLQDKKGVGMILNNDNFDGDVDSPTIIMPKIDKKLNVEESEDDLKISLDDNKNKAFNNFFNDDKQDMQKTRIVINNDIQNDVDDKSKKKKKKKSKSKNANLSKSDNFKVTLAAVLSAMLLVSIIGFFVIKAILIVPEVSVPDLLGLSEEDAREKAKESGVLLSVKERDYNNDYDEGEIYYQSEEAGSKVKKNYPLEVSISKGSKSSVIPNILGKYTIEATAMLNDMDLEKGDVTSQYSDTVPSGKIISQYPEANKEVDSGTKVDFVVSKGPEKKYTIVPNVIGFNVETAKGILTANSLNQGTIDYKYSDEYEANVVINQSHQAGKEVEENIYVNLVVSLGKNPETTKPEKPDGQGDEEKPNGEEDGNEETGNNEENDNTNTQGEQSMSQINIPLPTDKETAKIIVYKKTDIGDIEVFNQEVSTEESSYLVTVVGTGTEYFQVYVDDKLLHSEDGSDLIEIVFN